MSYYIIKQRTEPFNTVLVSDESDAYSLALYGAARVRPLPAYLPLRFHYQYPDRPDTPLAAGYFGAAALFSDALLELLYDLGADNVEAFPALLSNRIGDRQIVHKGYKAVAIMGAIACLDKKRTRKVDLDDGSGLIKGGVERMYIDEGKADGLLIFRPRPGMGSVLVHERVKNAIEAAKLPGLIFYSSEEWGGF